jgi:hypothetical protein
MIAIKPYRRAKNTKMSNADELCVLYTCDRPKIQPVFDEIIKALPLLPPTLVKENEHGKRLHEETSEMKT